MDDHSRAKEIGPLKESRNVPGVDAIMKPPLTPPGKEKTSFDRHNKRLLHATWKRENFF